MKDSSAEKLTAIEKDVLAEIRALRTDSSATLSRELLENPARLVYHLIRISHGNVQLRIITIARAIGIEMRTLERAFADEYEQTMTECQSAVRLEFARRMLSMDPPSKTGAIAAFLGYVRLQDFNRFFKKHMRQSPAEWGRTERERIAREGNNAKRGG